MRPLSDTAASMVKLLQRRRGFLERLVGDERDDIAALDRIATQPEAALVPWLTHVAFEEWGARGSAARRALSACVSVANPSELLELDEQCRRQWWYQGDAGARTGAGIVRASSVGIAELPTRAIGALSFHPSGRVRERAVKRLAATSGGLELPFLLIRLNDWVDVIARRAEEAVRARLLPAYAEEFVDQLPIVLRLESRKRRQ